jgi:hypothetical protein
MVHTVEPPLTFPERRAPQITFHRELTGLITQGVLPSVIFISLPAEMIANT